MDVSLPELVTWLVAGALAGWLAGLVVTRTKEGFGRFANLGIGLAGALIFLAALWYGRKLYREKDVGKIRLRQIWKKGAGTGARQNTSST